MQHGLARGCREAGAAQRRKRIERIMTKQREGEVKVVRYLSGLGYSRIPMPGYAPNSACFIRTTCPPEVMHRIRSIETVQDAHTHKRLIPKIIHQLNLFILFLATCLPVLTECLIFNWVPTNSNS